MENFYNYIDSKTRSDYQRNNFDAFLDKIKFVYKIPSIHIAGTNGKGTTANYLASVYQKHGYKVGLFTSPAIVDKNESILINGKPVSESDAIKIIEVHQKLIDKYDLSSFEILTFVALSLFQNQNCDIAIIECGMGGEEDATNVIHSTVLSIITTIGLEHTTYLGKSLSEIAHNKAGIIKREIPVLIGDIDVESENAIIEIAHENKSPIIKIGKYANAIINEIGYKFDYREFKDVQLSSIAYFNLNNAVLALEAFKILQSTFLVSNADIYEGLKEVKMNGRMSVVHNDPLIILDGAHNPEAMEKLTEAMEKYGKIQPIHIIFSCFKDKNISKMLSQLDLISNDIILTSFDHPRCRKQDDYFLFAEDYKYDDDYLHAIQNTIEKYPHEIIIITGSLAFVGRVINDFKNGLLKYDKNH